MVNDIIAAIANKLSEETGITVYADTVRQDMEIPCFIIDLVDSQNQRRPNGIRARRHNIAVTYLGPNQPAVRSMSDTLPELLETVRYKGNTYEGGQFRVNVDDAEHTVTCVVEYLTITRHVKDKPIMQSIRSNGGTK